MTPFEEFKDLMQIESADEYITESGCMSSQVNHLPEDLDIGIFVRQLWPKIKLKARILNPCTRV